MSFARDLLLKEKPAQGLLRQTNAVSNWLGAWLFEPSAKQTTHLTKAISLCHGMRFVYEVGLTPLRIHLPRQFSEVGGETSVARRHCFSSSRRKGPARCQTQEQTQKILCSYFKKFQIVNKKFGRRRVCSCARDAPKRYPLPWLHQRLWAEVVFAQRRRR